jgi:hypothetical protein
MPTDPDGRKLVFTSADFGVAYLVERWAARFVSELFQQFDVAFVGYGVNDPVMRYLVDAVCDCTVTVAFAGFYIEANLNHLIAELRRESDLKQAYGPNAGLKSKLAFVYAEYIASAPLARKDAYDRLEVEFPGITELANFRNGICHGTMNQTVAQLLPKTLELRQSAKNIVNRLFTAVNGRTGADLQRTLVTYWQALGINHLRDIEVGRRLHSRLTTVSVHRRCEQHYGKPKR